MRVVEQEKRSKQMIKEFQISNMFIKM